MKLTTLRLLMVLALLATFTSTACRVRQTEEGELPEVDADVSAEPGTLPDYDVDAGDVDVGTREITVTVPDVDVEGDEKATEGFGEEVPVPNTEPPAPPNRSR